MSNKDLAKQAKDRGNAAFQAGRVEDAIKEFSTAIELDGTDPVYWSNRSMAFASANQFDKALEDGNRAIALKPDWAKAYSRAGLALFKMNRLPEAKECYEKGLKAAPGDAGLQSALDETLRAMQPKNPLANLFGPDMFVKLAANPKTKNLLANPAFLQKMKMLQSNPMALGSLAQDQEVSLALSVLFGLPENAFDKSNVDEEDDAAAPMETDIPASAHREAPASAPAPKSAPKEPEPSLSEEELKEKELRKSADAEKERGNQLFGQKKFDEALEAYNKAVALCPKDAVYRSNRASVYIQRKQYDLAVQECKEAIEIGRENHADFTAIAKLWAKMGSAFEALGDLVEAKRAYEKSLVEHMDNKVKKSLQQLTQQIKDKEQVAYVNPELAGKHKDAGDAACKEGKWPDAIKEYTEALRRDPKNVKIMSNRALCYTKLMDWQRALDECESILKIDSKFVKAYLRKGKIQHLLKQYHKAIDTYNVGLQLEPTNADLLEAKRETMAAVAMENSSEQVDPQRQREAMKDPEIQGILKDPTISKVLQDMQRDPSSVRGAMNDPAIRSRIEKLIASGLLRVG